MKNLIIISILSILTSVVSTATATNYPDEYLGLPGDNLNLYATMKLFQESETLEGFERSLNDKNANINNLDLNGDHLVDYITVMDYVDGSVHTIVLRTALSRNETQDIAVFTVQQFDDGSAQIQLIGDEALYGRNYIVEPIYTDSRETPNPGYIGNSRVVETPAVVAVTTYQVAAWPIIRFIYRPGYICWHSSWTWGYYPTYWNPWRPYYWHTYYGYHSHFHNLYYSHYRHWDHYRYHRYNDFYYGHVRTYSPKVSSRIREGNYKTTYSRPDLRKRGDDLYARTARRSNSSTVVKSESRRSSSNPQTARSRSGNAVSSSSERRSISNNPARTRTSSTTNRGTERTQKSATVQSGRSTTNPYRGSKNAVSQKTESRSNSSYRTNSNSSASRYKEDRPKSANTGDRRASKSTSYRQSNSQPRQSSPAYSKKSSSQPKVSSRSSSSSSPSRQPKATSRNRSSTNRSSKEASRTRQSRSSSNEKTSRR